jgi:RNA polymerase sigma-70 factor (ECF subfamily)
VGPSDEDVSPAILEACRRGDRDALRVLYEAYKDRVYSIALYFFHGDATAAGDVTQQVFLKLMQVMAKFHGESAFSTWLYRLVVNACLDRARRGTRDPLPAAAAVLEAFPDPAASHEDLFVRGEVARSVRAAIASLPPKLRFAILLRYVDELSYADMAKALNCSIGTVASRLSRGHRLLARKLAPLRQALSSEGCVKGTT